MKQSSCRVKQAGAGGGTKHLRGSRRTCPGSVILNSLEEALLSAGTQGTPRDLHDAWKNGGIQLSKMKAKSIGSDIPGTVQLELLHWLSLIVVSPPASVLCPLSRVLPSGHRVLSERPGRRRLFNPRVRQPK